MNKPTLISIIIPTYNRAHIIAETLESLIKQTYTNWECLIVDDESTDNTEELIADYIKKDGRFSYYKRPNYRLKGPNSCRNFGFENCLGEYVNFFDSDDLYLPTALERASERFNDEVDGVILNAAETNFKTGEIITKNKIHSTNFLTDYFIGKITFLVCGPVWKRSFLEQQPFLLDETIRNADDWDFNLRMLYAHPNLEFIHDVLIYYRKHAHSFSKEVRKLNRLEIESYFLARDRHLHLIKEQANINNKTIEAYIINRYTKHLRRALYQNDAIKYFVYKKLMEKTLSFGYYLKILKYSFGFWLYIFFRRGVGLLKE